MRGIDAMSYDFNIDEIFEMACQIERNGAKFYRQMSENTKNMSIRQLFLDFAAMEEAHEKVLTSMRENLSKQEREPTIFDPEGETALYLQALADLRVFSDKAEADFTLSEESSEHAKTRKILRAVINREWEAIGFYLGMKEFVSENLGKNKIDNIIKEEMKHVRILSNNLTSLKG
jgi:rubrerythrin